jgi:hypothetical protein
MARPRGSKNKPKLEVVPDTVSAEPIPNRDPLGPKAEPGPKKFTGLARTMECVKVNGVFNNYYVLTLHIVDDIIMRKVYSEPRASFDARDLLDDMNGKSVMSRMLKWEHGKAWEV